MAHRTPIVISDLRGATFFLFLFSFDLRNTRSSDLLRPFGGVGDINLRWKLWKRRDFSGGNRSFYELRFSCSFWRLSEDYERFGMKGREEEDRE